MAGGSPSCWGSLRPLTNAGPSKVGLALFQPREAVVPGFSFLPRPHQPDGHSGCVDGVARFRGLLVGFPSNGIGHHNGFCKVIGTCAPGFPQSHQTVGSVLCSGSLFAVCLCLDGFREDVKSPHSSHFARARWLKAVVFLRLPPHFQKGLVTCSPFMATSG